jgi:hypothetical protein
MRSKPRTPWLSLLLLLVSYANFGRLLAESNANWYVWGLATGLAMLVAEALASPWSLIRTVIIRWLKSDTRAFITVMASAFLAVAVLNWFHISAQGILLVTASALVRLDAQILGTSDLQAFFIVMSVSLLGLGVGWLWNYFLY